MPILQIPITKAGKGVTFDVDTDLFNSLLADNPEAALRIVEEGFKAILNSRMTSKEFGAPSKLEGDALEAQKAAALAKAQKNLDDLVAGNLSKKAKSAKAAGVDRAVMTEAVRLAKEVVKNEIRRAGMKVSMVAAKDITAAAKVQVEQDPSYIEQAKANIAERASIQSAINIATLISEDPKKVAKAKKEAEERKAARQLSAAQAGKTEKRSAKGKVPPRRPDASISAH